MIQFQVTEKLNLILSFDDYCPQNEKLAKMLKFIGLPATFFIETGRHPEALKQIQDLFQMGFEIGCHTHNHPSDIKTLPNQEVIQEIQNSKELIEGITGQPCEVFAYPRGRYNDDTIKILNGLGFKEARTTRVMALDSLDPMELSTTVHVYNGRKEYEGKTWLEVANEMLNRGLEECGTFHLWGHAWEIDRDDQWHELNGFLRQLKDMSVDNTHIVKTNN